MTKQRTFRERASRGFAWNYLYKLTEFGLMNCYTILVVRHFGPDISAPYAVFTALCSTLSIICAFAVDGVLLRYIQRISANENSGDTDISNIENFALPRFLKTLFAFRILVVTVVSVLIVITLYFLPLLVPSYAETLGSVRKFSPFMIVFLYAQAVTAFCTFSLIGLLETKRVFFASLVSRGFLLAAGLFLIIKGSLSLQYAIGLFIISAVINALFLLFAFSGESKKHAGSSINKRSYQVSSVIKEVWQMVNQMRHVRLFLATPLMLYGITTWGSDLLSTVLGRQPDILMMRAILGEYSPEIGYYLSASILLLVTEYVFLFGLGGTLVSIFSKLAHDDEKIHEKKSYPSLSRARKEIAGFQNVVILPLCAYMLVFAPTVMQAVYGDKYSAATPMIRIGLAALALAVGFFGGGMQVTSLVAIGKERLVFRNRLFWGITNVAANFFLIRSYGGLGAIIGTQFANAFACGSESYFAGKIIDTSFDFFGTFRIIVISAVSVALVYYLIQLTGNESSYLINSVISLISMGAITSCFYILLKIPEAKKVWHRLQGLFQRKQTGIVNE